MFVKDNQDGSDKTQINYLGFIGTPVSATNMADFKRVSLPLCIYSCAFILGGITESNYAFCNRCYWGAVGHS